MTWSFQNSWNNQMQKVPFLASATFNRSNNITAILLLLIILYYLGYSLLLELASVQTQQKLPVTWLSDLLLPTACPPILPKILEPLTELVLLCPTSLIDCLVNETICFHLQAWLRLYTSTPLTSKPEPIHLQLLTLAQPVIHAWLLSVWAAVSADFQLRIGSSNRCSPIL